jgi:hypothetical protein
VEDQVKLALKTILYCFCISANVQEIGGIKRSAEGTLHLKSLVCYETDIDMVTQVVPASNVSYCSNQHNILGKICIWDC